MCDAALLLEQTSDLQYAFPIKPQPPKVFHFLVPLLCMYDLYQQRFATNTKQDILTYLGLI